LNGDQKKDVVFGHVTCSNVSVMLNEGSAQTANFKAADYSWPATKPIDFPIFQSLFFEDMDFDGKRDLIASSNSYDNYAQTVDFAQTIWWYKNTGTDARPTFEFQAPDLLQNTMLDLGENAYPTAADWDGDGDQDLFVGFAGRRADRGYRASIFYFENIGTPQNPSFKLHSNDFLDISKSYQLTDLKPFVQDMNADGVLDFGFVARSLRNNVEVRYWPNRGPRGGVFKVSGDDLVEFFPEKELSASETPVFTDFDQDNKIDLLVGNAGGISQYKNVGSNQKPVYQLITDKFGGITNPVFGGITLTVSDLNADGKDDLLVSSKEGSLSLYSDFKSQIGKFKEETFVLKNTENQSFDTKYSFGNMGQISTADLNADGLPEIILGMRAGGVKLFQNTSTKATKPNENALGIIFPNPTDGYLYLRTPENAQVVLQNIAGQILETKQAKANQELFFDVSAYSTGTYVVKITLENGNVQIHKVIKN
jgi:hypothetical protein